MKPTHFLLRDRTDDFNLKEFGFGIEAFPNFISTAGTLHTHDLVELVYIEKGEGSHLLKDEEHPAVVGSLAIIHYNQAHGFKTKKDGLDLVNLYLDMNRFSLPLMPKELQPVLPQILPLHPRFRHNLRDVVILQMENPGRVSGILRAMRQEMEIRPTGFEETLRHYFALFLIEACRGYQLRQQEPERLESGKKSIHSGQRIKQLCHYLDSHFTEPIHLDELAHFTGLQKNYLCRIFKAETGQTILNYVIHQRLGQAMLLLRQTDSSVIEIALESGFNDLPHFNRTFLREVGKSPSAYRHEWA